MNLKYNRTLDNMYPLPSNTPSIPNLSSAPIVEFNKPLYQICTGISDIYDMNWMSTAPNRRDIPSGVSGCHLAAKVETCLTELELTMPYPVDSYLFTFSANLRLCDLTNYLDSTGSGICYGSNLPIWHKTIDQHEKYFQKNNIDGILRYSRRALDLGKHEEVIVLFAWATGRRTLMETLPLGTPTANPNVKLSNGQIFPMFNYYPKNYSKGG